MNAAIAEASADRCDAGWAPGSIVLVGPLPPPSGGMANQTRQLARLLAEEGCNVALVKSNAPYWPCWIGRIRGVRALIRLLPFVRNLWRATAGAELVHVMANSGWAWHLFAAPAIWIASLRGVPVLVNYRGGDAERFLARQIAFVRPTLTRARLLIVPSEFLRDVFARYDVAATIVPNVVNLNAFRPTAALDSTPRLLVTRNLEAIYDIATAIRAFALVRVRHPTARLTIAGSGPERAALECLARDLGAGAAVTFTGRLDNAELPELYRAATTVLNPSRVDNMPNSLLEALASGVPIVSTDVGGVRWLVEHERTALLVPPGEPHEMAQAILRLHDDAELVARLRAAGLADSARFGWSQVRPRLFDAYARACAHPRFAQQAS